MFYKENYKHCGIYYYFLINFTYDFNNSVALLTLCLMKPVPLTRSSLLLTLVHLADALVFILPRRVFVALPRLPAVAAARKVTNRSAADEVRRVASSCPACSTPQQYLCLIRPYDAVCVSFQTRSNC